MRVDCENGVYHITPSNRSEHNRVIEHNRAFSLSSLPGLQELWRETHGDPRVCVAVLDGPVDTSHHSLAAAHFTKVETLVSGVADQRAASQHGTHITSVIFGQHDSAVQGVAPRCRGLLIPLFANRPDGEIAPCSQVDLARAISQAVQHGAHVINISGGEFNSSGTAHPLLADAVRDCVKKGVLIVAAAGNQGCECLHIPGALPSVLAVGAMNETGEPLAFSNWGEKYRAQGILAPGENILGAVPFGDVAINSGTSFATPIVSGIAALLLSLQLRNGQKLDPLAVRTAILNSAIGCEEHPIANCDRLLVGRLNIKGAHAVFNQKGANGMTELTAKEGHASQTASELPPTSNDVDRDTGKAEIHASQVTAAGCGCGGGGNAAPQLVFAIGQLGYDFGTEARRDSIMQHMESPTGSPIPPNPHDPRQLLAYLEKNPADADSIYWTLNLDATPIYAIKPKDAFAMETYLRLRQFLHEQASGEIERISVGAVIYSSARLLSGQVVPVICPNLRCMNSWNTGALLDAVLGSSREAEEPKKRREKDKAEAVRNFLERVYHDLRNLGVDPCHRAINYSATNALNVANIFESALKDNMQLDAIECERSPICRPESDCWEVKLAFFDPENQLTRARKVYRFSVDVSDICPVMVGPVRSWFVR